MWLDRFPRWRMPRFTARSRNPLVLACFGLAWVWLASLFVAVWLVESAVWIDVRAIVGLFQLGPVVWDVVAEVLFP